MAGIARRCRLALACAVVTLAASAAFATQPEPERTGGPYVPTPQVVVDRMLAMANVGSGDYVVDLGAGDGVIVLTAARQFNARGLGVDIDAELVKLANEQAARLGVAEQARFEVMDIFQADLSRATVVTLYLLPGMMSELRSKIFNELKPGTRVVSHDYHFEEWRADDTVTFEVAEKEKVNGLPSATVWLWIVPARISGRWKLEVDGGASYEVTWRQHYQLVDGGAVQGARKLKVREASLRGEDIAFVLDGRTFRGKAGDAAMRGTVQLAPGRTARWTATRLETRQTASVD